VIDVSNRTVFGEEHTIFREQVRRFLEREVTPHLPAWEQAGIVDRNIWRRAGEAGLLCPTVPEMYGGLGLDYRYNAVVCEELAYRGAHLGFTLQSDVITGYLLSQGSEAQKQRWLPRMVSGETICAIAMTEPGAGSDLKAIGATARREGDHYVINGSKTYISNGQNADLIIVVAKTEPDKGAKGVSLILVEADRAGFARGKNLDKIGQDAADTSELFFTDVRVPTSNLLGPENGGFAILMSQLPQERLSIALAAQAGAQRAFDEAVTFTRDRRAFGQVVLDFQNTRFVLADLQSKLQVGWAHIDWALQRHVAGKLTPQEGAAAKLWHSEMEWEAMDRALQLHGGAGYMNAYPIARLWRDARVRRIYGGTSEIMKELIGRHIRAGTAD
jgi:acyl-CoA dehydrogenase